MKRYILIKGRSNTCNGCCFLSKDKDCTILNVDVLRIGQKCWDNNYDMIYKYIDIKTNVNIRVL
jgi:hypothetical protein